MIAKAFVNFYRLVHGGLHMRGAGFLIRRVARVLPGLQTYPYTLPDVGTVTLDFRDGSSCQMVNYSMGELSPNEFQYELMELCLTRGDVLWDVGANLGWVSAYFARPKFGLAAIHSFEPNPPAYKPLQSLFAGSSLVTTYPFALGSSNATAQLNFVPGETQISSLRVPLPGQEVVSIPVRRGDDVQAELNLPFPDVVKIDVEGFELQVIDGMRRVIAQKQAIVFFEYQFLSDVEIRGCIPPGYGILLMMDDGTVTEDFSRRALGHDAVVFPEPKRSLFNKIPRS